MTDVKMNFKNKYENWECRACHKEEESQKHIYECIEIVKNNENKTKMIKYENIFGENTRHQVEIAKIFLENLNTLKWEKKEIILENNLPSVVYVTGYLSVSAVFVWWFGINLLLLL